MGVGDANGAVAGQPGHAVLAAQTQSVSDESNALMKVRSDLPSKGSPDTAVPRGVEQSGD